MCSTKPWGSDTQRLPQFSAIFRINSLAGTCPPAPPHAAPSIRRRPQKLSCAQWNHSAGWHVVLVVGMSRGVGAALAAAAVMLSGCGSTVESTTTSPPPEASVNPWDLPLEERPDLFDPCAEIPIEAVEGALGGPVEPIDLFTRHQPGELLACGWASDEVDLSILSTWKSHSEYLNDSAIAVLDAEHYAGDRPGVRGTERRGSENFGCIQLFFTEKGTVWVRSDLVGTFEEYRGERFTDPCKALDDATPALVTHIPAGDYR